MSAFSETPGTSLGHGSPGENALEKPQRLTDLAYRWLREAIADFSLMPGQSVGEPELSARLGISRNSTREALIRLEAAGFVSRRAGGRWFVYVMTPKDAEEVYECRASLEGLAVYRAAEKASTGDFDAAPLRQHLIAARQAFDEKDFEAVARHSGEFHDDLIASADNQKLISLIDALQPQFRFNRLMMMRHGARSGFLSENEALLDAVVAGDGELARKTVEEITANDLSAVLRLHEDGHL